MGQFNIRGERRATIPWRDPDVANVIPPTCRCCVGPQKLHQVTLEIAFNELFRPILYQDDASWLYHCQGRQTY